MFLYNTEIHGGIVFIKLIGNLDHHTFHSLSDEINHLLYHYGFQNYVFDFHNIEKLDESVFVLLQNKLTEIFLSCGRIVMSGLQKQTQKFVGKYKELFFVSNEVEAFKYLSL